MPKNCGCTSFGRQLSCVFLMRDLTVSIWFVSEIFCTKKMEEKCIVLLKRTLGFDEVQTDYISCWKYLLNALVAINSSEQIEDLEEVHISKDNVKNALELCSDLFFCRSC